MFARLRAGSLILWITLTYVFFGLAARAFRPFREDELLAGQALSVVLYLLPPLWLLYLIRKGLPDPAGLFPRRNPGFPLLRGLGWLAVAMVFRIFSLITLYGLLAIAFPEFVDGWLLRDFRIVQVPEQREYPMLGTALSLLLVLVLAPVTEEIVFRGVLLHRVWHQWGLAPAILGTSVLFALLHAEFFGTLVLSLFLSLIYLHSRSLLYPILFHFLNNALAAAGDIADSRGLGETESLTVLWLQENWWRGLPFGVVSIPLIVYILVKHWPRVRPF